MNHVNQVHTLGLEPTCRPNRGPYVPSRGCGQIRAHDDVPILEHTGFGAKPSRSGRAAAISSGLHIGEQGCLLHFSQFVTHI